MTLAPTSINSNPGAQVGTRFFRGQGTSQAAAITSGAVALLLSQRPNLTPDQVKYLLTHNTQDMPSADPLAAGNGSIDVQAASQAHVPSSSQSRQLFTPSTGLGSLELARGSVHLIDNTNGVILQGEVDIFGAPFDAAAQAALALTGNTWSGGLWNGNTWSGNTWSGNTWSGNTWSGNTWSGNTWSGNTWSGNTWSGNTWSGNTWTGNTWSGNTWSGNTWSGNTWSSAGYGNSMTTLAPSPAPATTPTPPLSPPIPTTAPSVTPSATPALDPLTILLRL